MNRHPRGRAFRSVTAAAALLAAAAPVLAQYSAISGDVTVTPQTGSFYTTDQLVPVESKYIPNVVWRENGAASTEALKVQAVAARGYLYYKLSQTPNGGKATSIRDGTADQVYSKAGTAPLTRATATSAQQKYFDVTDATEREILIVNTSATATPRWEPVCTFYVAGGKPDTAATTTWWPNGAPLGQWETGDTDTTNTDRWVTYNRGSTAWNPTPLGSLTNPVNRGAMSQNGANFLSTGRTAPVGATYGSFSSWNYFDILKYYYGQGSQLMLAKVPASGELPLNQKVLASFDLDEGYLRNPMNFSATNAFVDTAASSHFRDTSTAHAGSASQRINIVRPTPDPTSNSVYRHMSGMVMGTEADPNLNNNLIGTAVSNILIENRGSLGFWLKTTTPNLQVRPLVDEAAATEQGLLRNVVPDGVWHKYEWFLTDNAEWQNFSGGDGVLAGQWSLDSILFIGSSNASLNLDTLFYDARTTPPTNQWVYDYSGGSFNFGGNWVRGAPNAIGATANFLNLTSARRTVVVNSSVTLGTINFANSFGYDVNGPAMITLDAVGSGQAAINASGGTHTINANLKLNDDTLYTSGSGNTTFNGNIDGAGRTLTINSNGTVTLKNGTLAALDAPAGQIVQSVGGTLSVAGEITTGAANTFNPRGTVNAARIRAGGLLNVEGTVNIAANGTAAGMTTVGALTIAPGAKLNLNDNDLIVDYADGTPSPEFTLRDYVKAVVNGGASGIFFTPGEGDVVLAIAEQAKWGFTTFNGMTLDDTSVVGKYTYYGDANLDGKVTSDDYIAVDVGLGSGDSWVQGDFNFSGTVTSDDYVAIDVNLGKGTPTPLAWAEFKSDMIALHTEMFGAEYLEKLAYAEANGFGASLVPEPGALSLACIVAIPLLRRRRRIKPR